jgi:hypothetical protein
MGQRSAITAEAVVVIAHPAGCAEAAGPGRGVSGLRAIGAAVASAESAAGLNGQRFRTAFFHS